MNTNGAKKKVLTLFVDARAFTTPLTAGNGNEDVSLGGAEMRSSSAEAGEGRLSHHSAPIVHSLSKLYTLKSKREESARS